jgi:hypothetical protein
LHALTFFYKKGTIYKMSDDEREVLLTKFGIHLVNGRYACFMDYYSVYIEPKIKLNLKEFQIMQECYYAECKHIGIIGLQDGPCAKFWADQVIPTVFRDRALSGFR